MASLHFLLHSLSGEGGGAGEGRPQHVLPLSKQNACPNFLSVERPMDKVSRLLSVRLNKNNHVTGHKVCYLHSLQL